MFTNKACQAQKPAAFDIFGIERCLFPLDIVEKALPVKTQINVWIFVQYAHVTYHADVQMNTKIAESKARRF